MKDGEPMALVSAGFVHCGLIYVRAATQAGWKLMSLPLSEFYALLHVKEEEEGPA